MIVDVVVPDLGEGVEEATVVEWLRDVGDRVDRGEPVVTLELDKIDTDVTSPTAGVVVAHLAAPEDAVTVGQTLATVDDDR